MAQIINNVMSYAAEAELGAIYIVAREAVYIRSILAEMGHKQPKKQSKQTTSQNKE